MDIALSNDDKTTPFLPTNPVLDRQAKGGQDEATTTPILASTTERHAADGTRTGNEIGRVVHSSTNDIDHDNDDGYNPQQYNHMTVDEALKLVGVGRFQYLLAVLSGMVRASGLVCGWWAFELEWFGPKLKGEKHFLHENLRAEEGLGYLLGTLILCVLADRIGRKPITVAAPLIFSLAGLGTALSSTYPQFAFFQALIRFGLGASFVPYDLVVEFMPSSSNSLGKVSFCSFFALQLLLRSGIDLAMKINTNFANVPHHWTILIALNSLPSVIFTVLSIVWIPESPRWLLRPSRDGTRNAQQRQKQALATLRRVAKMNGRQDAEILFPPNTVLTHSDPTDAFTGRSLSSSLCLVLCLAVVWCASSTEAIIGEKTVAHHFGIPASRWNGLLSLVMMTLIVDWWGRTVALFATSIMGVTSFLFCGLLFILAASDSNMMEITKGFVVPLALHGSYFVIWILTVELLPTKYRASGHGFFELVSRPSAGFASLLLTLDHERPYILTGLCILVACLSKFCLPETKGQDGSASNTSGGGGGGSFVSLWSNNNIINNSNNTTTTGNTAVGYVPVAHQEEENSIPENGFEMSIASMEDTTTTTTITTNPGV